jgi:hypothetical protein
MKQIHPYYKWLIRQRAFCEGRNCFSRATTVVNVDGKDIVFCQEHATRLRASRASCQKQELGKCSVCGGPVTQANIAKHRTCKGTDARTVARN